MKACANSSGEVDERGRVIGVARRTEDKGLTVVRDRFLQILYLAELIKAVANSISKVKENPCTFRTQLVKTVEGLTVAQNHFIQFLFSSCLDGISQPFLSSSRPSLYVL